MNIKEHLQFPARSVEEPAAVALSQAEGGQTSAQDTDIGPVSFTSDR